MGGVLNNIKSVWHKGKMIKEIWHEGKLLWQYDSTAPTLTVSAPAGTASASPTYTLTGATYRVQGTVSDADSGVKAVYVNGAAATISGSTWYKDVTLTAHNITPIEVYAVDNAGNQTDTITRYVCYDNAVPSLAVAAPTGTSSSSPTYVQSDSAYSYTVSGTVSDASGIKSVTVNGQSATISGNNWSKTLSLATNTTHTITIVATDNAGRTTTVNRYLCVEPRASATYSSLWQENQKGSGDGAHIVTLTAWGSKSLIGPLVDSGGSIKVLRDCTLNIYLSVVLHVTVAGNTYFASIAKNGSSVAKTNHADTPNYYDTPISVSYKGSFKAGDIISAQVGSDYTAAYSTLKVHRDINKLTVTQA